MNPINTPAPFSAEEEKQIRGMAEFDPDLMNPKAACFIGDVLLDTNPIPRLFATLDAERARADAAGKRLSELGSLIPDYVRQNAREALADDDAPGDEKDYAARLLAVLGDK